MKYSDATKALIAAVLDGQTLQCRAKAVDGKQDPWEDETRQANYIIDALLGYERLGSDADYEWRVKPGGQHVYTLVLKDKVSGRNLLMANREMLDDARKDVKNNPEDQWYRPLYILHHEFDPEDGSLRNTKVITLANEAKS